MSKKNLSNLVIDWYKKNFRSLPWRPNNISQKIDPYLVFVSEFMLQQTTVKTVVPYFTTFVRRFPKNAKLAKANLEDVLSIWSGLGYYRRANYLLLSSKIISTKFYNKIPQDYNELIKLPGIGDYTAAAISSIAFDKKNIVVDGNIERVLSRVYTILESGTSLKKEIKKMLLKNVPNKYNSLFVQGLMDIGATICTPKVVKCNLCPLENICFSAHTKNYLKYPVKPIKIKKKRRVGNFYCIFNKKKEVLFLKNNKKGLFENMFVLPSHGWQKSDFNINLELFSIIKKINCGIVKHSFTHFDLNANVTIFFIENDNFNINIEHEFLNSKKLKSKEVPTLYNKIIKIALEKLNV